MRALSNFSCAGSVPETVLLGNLEVRTVERIDWGGPAMKQRKSISSENMEKVGYFRLFFESQSFMFTRDYKTFTLL